MAVRFAVRWAWRLTVLAVVAAVAVVGVTAVRVWHFARTDDRGPADALVVMGAAQADGRPGVVLDARLEHALDLYEAGAAPLVVTTGGGRTGDRTTEAAAARDWLVARGVPSDAVVAVGEGGDTLRSVEAVADRLAGQVGSVVVVTDPWHALRATSMASDAGFDAVSSPTRQGPTVWSRETQVRYVGRETAAYLWWQAAGGAPWTGVLR